jgi:GDP-L-fucose synthase
LFKKKIFIAGHMGMVGSAIKRLLESNNSINLLISDRSELDLTNQSEVNKFFANQKIDEVYLAAAKVGGIFANNNFPADFIYENMMIQTNVISAAHKANIDKLLFLGSSCIYPKDSKQPINENALLTGQLERTNEPYAISKIAGIKLCESYNRQYGRDFRSIMPTNLYGPGDNFNLENSHVVPALIRKFHEAKSCNSNSITLWGTGKPRREFLHVDDMAEAAIFIMNLDKAEITKHTLSMNSHINVGLGSDISIHDLAKLIAKIVGFKGVIYWDKDKPDGTKRKLLDIKLINKLGWKAKIYIKTGLEKTYQWFLDQEYLRIN